jgi:hypothetical protein
MGGNVQQCGVDPRRRAFRWRQDESSKLWTRRFQFATFATAGVAQTLDMTAFPGGALIEGAFLVLIQNFAGGGSATATFSAGTTGTPTAYINAADVFTGAAANAPIARPGATLVPGTFLQGTGNLDSGATVRFTLTVDVNTNLLTTGILDVYLRLRFVAIKPSPV